MSVELARRLLDGGASAASIEAALLVEAVQGVPFVQALLERFPELSPLVDREVERGTDVEEVHWVRASPELAALVPDGMCQRLLAVPLRRDPSSGMVDLAAAEVLDPHVAHEFEYQLESPVRLWRASPAAVREALRQLEGEVQRASAPRSTWRPPPERPAEPARVERSAEGGRREHAGSRPPPATSRSGTGTWPPPRPSFGEAVEARPGGETTPSPRSGRAPFAFASQLEDGILELARADSPHEVTRLLCAAFEPADALVATPRVGGFEVRARSRSLSDVRFETLALPVGWGSILDQALRAGFYLGPLPASGPHAPLRALLPREAADEVYVAPGLLGGRAAFVIMIARFGASLEATRRADRLIQAACLSIERILRERKHRP